MQREKIGDGKWVEYRDNDSIAVTTEIMGEVTQSIALNETEWQALKSFVKRSMEL